MNFGERIESNSRLVAVLKLPWIRHRRRPSLREIKKASPSKGLLAPDFRPPDPGPGLSGEWRRGFIRADERKYFLGAPELISELRPHVHIAICAQDFILEMIQVYESAAIGADALLLIVSTLEAGMLRALLLDSELGSEALVEVYTKEELTRALDAGADLIGINHRNLRKFKWI